MEQRRYGGRYKARQRAVDLLFEAEFRDTDPLEVLALHQSLTSPDDAQEIYRPIREYTETLVRGVATKLDEVDGAIGRHLDDTWSLERLPAIDRAVLRVSAWELLFNSEVPASASIRDAIELSANYSTTVAPGYINVTLDGIVKDPQPIPDPADEKPAEDSQELAADEFAEAEAMPSAGEVDTPQTDAEPEAHSQPGADAESEEQVEPDADAEPEVHSEPQDQAASADTTEPAAD